MSRTTPPPIQTQPGPRTGEPSILIGAGDPGTAATFSLWLESDFDAIETVTTPTDFPTRLTDAVGVVILDTTFATEDQVFAAIRDAPTDPRVLAIGDDDDMPLGYVDDHLDAPVGRMELSESVRSRHRQARYDRCVQALFELATTRADVMTDGGAVDPRLEELETRIEALRETTSETVEEFDEQDFEALLRGTAHS